VPDAAALFSAASWQTTALILLILAAATFFHALLGFGTASVAMPLLLIFDLLDYTATLALVGLFVLFALMRMLAAGSWKNADIPTVKSLTLWSLLGVPLGVWVLLLAAEDHLKMALGALVIVASVYQLVRPPVRPVAGLRQWCGLLAGVAGTACNTNAPPVVVYCASRRWNPIVLHATLQLYFLPVAIVFSVAHLALGYFSSGIAVLGIAAGLILWFVTIPLGLKLRHRIPEQHLRTLMHWCLIVLSVPLLF
jgi:uncharacterized protein